MAFFSCLSCFKPVEEVEVTELDFSHNSLNDVPNDVFVHERTLEDLCLDSNNIRDLPRQLFHCHGLKHLKISDNDIHFLPPALSSLSQLVELDISKNVLTDIPDTIKQCKQLTVLDASINPLQKIPEGCTQLLSITELYLNDTFLEFLPANFGRLAKLKILELRENGLNNLPKSLSRLTCLERLDIGQNEISEIPEVIGSLTNLKELWIDCNRVKQVPPSIGNLKNLVHLNLDINRIDLISDNICNCTLLTDLSLCTNELKELPEMGFAGLESLVTLKLDDNQIEELPMAIGKLKNLEELFLSQNYLENLPPSIGLCRKLHTLNVDDNDIEYLPKELGSCISLKILSAHGNRLITLPAELDHISNLAVINLTANNIRYLPVSLTKLTKISAIWLSENQHKPLVQLNQDTDPETGQRVLTNFLLPQSMQNQHDYKDNVSESGSFHASVWEEERQKKSLVKWREGGTDIGDADGHGFDDNQANGDTGGGKGLRREPTPFPKEMRAMAKRAQNLRNKNSQNGSSNVTQVEQHPADAIQRKKNKEHRPRMTRKDVMEEEVDGNKVMRSTINAMSQVERSVPNEDVSNNVSHQQQSPNVLIQGNIQIKEAKVTKANASPVLSERHILSVYQDEKTAKEEIELSQFEELERAILSNKQTEIGNNRMESNKQILTRMSPDKNSRDSGILTPSECGTNSGSRTSPEQDQPVISSMSRNPSDPLPQAPVSNATRNNLHNEMMVMPVKAEIVTTELNDPNQKHQEMVPPPYHIAASMSKHASDFKSIHLPSQDGHGEEYNNG
jgi:erbb2-interacting protein